MSNPHPYPISVVMTSYNTQEFIQEAIESILNQTLKDFEFIIIDNNSHDDTVDIIKSFNDQRIKFIQNEVNLGQTKALNIGIEQAQGEYITRMDADDVSHPERLKKQFQYLELNPNVGLVGSWSIDINEKGKRLKTYRVPTDSFWIKSCLSSSGDLTSWCITHPSVMIRKSVLEDVGLYNEEKSLPGYPQDYDLWNRMIQKCDMANIPLPLIKYRVLDGSESRAFREETIQFCRDITRQKIRLIVPDIEQGEMEGLTNMLEFQHQVSKEQGNQVLALFDRYFKAFMGKIKNEGMLKKTAARIKLYYLPLLFKTNPLKSVLSFFTIIIQSPTLLFDSKFYRKWAKVTLQSICSGKQYSTFKKYFSIYR